MREGLAWEIHSDLVLFVLGGTSGFTVRIRPRTEKETCFFCWLYCFQLASLADFCNLIPSYTSAPTAVYLMWQTPQRVHPCLPLLMDLLSLNLSNPSWICWDSQLPQNHMATSSQSSLLTATKVLVFNWSPINFIKFPLGPAVQDSAFSSSTTFVILSVVQVIAEILEALQYWIGNQKLFGSLCCTKIAGLSPTLDYYPHIWKHQHTGPSLLTCRQSAHSALR